MRFTSAVDRASHVCESGSLSPSLRSARRAGCRVHSINRRYGPSSCQLVYAIRASLITSTPRDSTWTDRRGADSVGLPTGTASVMRFTEASVRPKTRHCDVCRQVHEVGRCPPDGGQDGSAGRLGSEKQDEASPFERIHRVLSRNGGTMLAEPEWNPTGRENGKQSALPGVQSRMFAWQVGPRTAS